MSETNTPPQTPDRHETLGEQPFNLQTPHEFRDDFVSSMAKATEKVGLETMQFEICDDTGPIFEGLKDAKQRIDDVELRYDRFALRHIRDGEGENESEALVLFGRAAITRRGGNMAALREAVARRDRTIEDLENLEITDPGNKKRGECKHLSHDHVKLAFTDDTAWFGTMNLRAVDFKMSNFMVKTTDPYFVDAIKEVFAQTERTTDKVFNTHDEAGQIKTALLLDAGVKKQSVIYNTALKMADSLQAGDRFTFIGQWPPVKIMFGPLVEKLDEKTDGGVHGTYLMSPTENLHPVRRAAHLLQRQVDERQYGNPNMEAINLARQTHAKAFLIERADGSREVLFGSHNLTKKTVRNGTRELSMWSKDPAIVDQISNFLDTVRAEG